MLEWALVGSVLHVPSLWLWEVLNVLAVVIRKGRITGDRGQEFLDQLASLNIRIDHAPHVGDLPRLHSLAAIHQLTAYDVAYLDLAKRLSLRLATLDEALIRAADREGVEILLNPCIWGVLFKGDS
jgi:predicted nucleic acid-binding protein